MPKNKPINEDEYFDEAMIAKIDRAMKSIDEGKGVIVTLDDLRAMADAIPPKNPRKKK